MSFLFPYQHSNTTLEFFTTPAGVCATYCFSPQISKCSHTSSWALLKFSQEDPSGLPMKNYVISIPPPTYLPSYLLFQLNFFDLKNYLVIFNWLMIGLQYWFDFCHTSTWVNHKCTFVPSLLNLPPTSRPFPPPAHSHLSRLLQSPSLSFLSCTANSHWPSIYMLVYMLPCYSSPFISPSPSFPPLLSISLFSMSASPLLLCK